MPAKPVITKKRSTSAKSAATKKRLAPAKAGTSKKGKAAGSSAKRARVLYQPPPDLLSLPVHPNPTHGGRSGAQKRYRSTGDTHESEHAYGYDVLARNRGRPGKGILGRLEADAPAYQESRHFHREHIGTGMHGEAQEGPAAKKAKTDSGTREIEQTDREDLKVAHQDRRLAILSRMTSRSGKWPGEDQERIVKELVEGHHSEPRPNLDEHMAHVLKWMGSADAEPVPGDRGAPDVHGFSSSAAYREAQADSLDNVPMKLSNDAAKDPAKTNPSDVMQWGADALGHAKPGPSGYVADRRKEGEQRIGDAMQLNQLGYAFEPGFQRQSELPGTPEVAARIASPQERLAQLQAADHSFVSMALNMGTVPIVKADKAPEIRKYVKAKRKASADDT